MKVYMAKSLRLLILCILVLEVMVSVAPINAAVEPKRSGKQPMAWVSNMENNGFRSSIKPLTVVEALDYVQYDCSLGSYRMSRAEPSWKFIERSGTMLAPSSRFIIQRNSQGSWLDLNITNIQTSYSTPQFTYTFTVVNLGTAKVTAEFFAKTPPKFTVAFTKTSVGDTRIVWKTTVPQAWQYYTIDDNTVTNWGSGTHTQNMDRVRILDASVVANSQLSLMVDWSDYGETMVQLKGSTINVFFPTNQNNIDPTLYEYYDSGDDMGWPIMSNWAAQTFRSSTPFNLETISLKLYRTNSPGTFYIRLRYAEALDDGYIPIGSDLTSTTFNGNSLTTDTGGAWYNITLSQSIFSNINYAIVINAPSGDLVNRVNWRIDSTSPTYPNGTMATWIAGGSWVERSEYDAMFRLYGGGYAFNFVGLCDEATGDLMDVADRPVNVTAHFSDGTADYIFLVDGTAQYVTSANILYFEYNTSKIRQYWLANDEFNGTFYIFDYDKIATTTTTGYTWDWETNQTVYDTTTTYVSALTTYTVNFFDASGILVNYPYIAAKHYINGTLVTVEKKKVDALNQAQFQFKNGERYSLSIESYTAVYSFGDIEASATTTISLTVKGLEFPSNIILAYTKIRMYADRTNNHSYINFYYEDTTSETVSVICTIYYANDSVAYTSTQTSQSFTDTYTTADYSTSYYGEMVASHQIYGTLTYRLVFPLAYSSNPWGLDFLGSLPGNINTNVIIPSFLILCAFGVFSRLNAYVGMFAGVAVAGLFVWIGWNSTTSIAMIITALTFTILYALARKRRRAYE